MFWQGLGGWIQASLFPLGSFPECLGNWTKVAFPRTVCSNAGKPHDILWTKEQANYLWSWVNVCPEHWPRKNHQQRSGNKHLEGTILHINLVSNASKITQFQIILFLPWVCEFHNLSPKQTSQQGKDRLLQRCSSVSSPPMSSWLMSTREAWITESFLKVAVKGTFIFQLPWKLTSWKYQTPLHQEAKKSGVLSLCTQNFPPQWDRFECPWEIGGSSWGRQR